MDIQYGNTGYLLLIGVGLALIALVFYGEFTRRLAVRRFATANRLGVLAQSNPTWRRAISSVLLTAAHSLLCLALVDMRWGKIEQEVPQRGIEVMFVLDVSRSMLAADAAPSRLERAKQQIKDLIDEMSGDRIGLVLFAGEARQVVPLTSHYDEFIQTLDAVTPDSLQLGGSKLGDAIRSAANSFIDKTKDHKAMVIFTDGEDQESKPIEAAETALSEKGIRIFTVGLGDMEQGARVPSAASSGRTQFLNYKGEAVWSKLNGATLSEIANKTGGAYIPAGTKRVNMAAVYHGYIASVEQTEFEMAKVNAYIPRFQWFALPALLLLILEAFLSSFRGHQTARQLASAAQISKAAYGQGD